jgi:hypothetical protein
MKVTENILTLKRQEKERKAKARIIYRSSDKREKCMVTAQRPESTTQEL